MITFTVIAFNDAPTDGTLQAHFDELGGTIGRAETNQLVLPDPERMVSRVAAQVVYRNGSFSIIDRGSNPILLNGRALSSGHEAPLAAGDKLRICGYELAVKLGSTSASAASADPFAGLLGQPAPAPAARAPALADPLFAPAPQRKPSTAAPPPSSGGIPDDWDPFAPAPAPAASPAGGRRDALGLDLGAAAPAPLDPGWDAAAAPGALDQLFGLGPGGGADPLANTALDAPLAQPNMAADDDPLRSLNSAPKASAASEPDRLSDLQRPFFPPPAIKPAPATEPRAQPTAPRAEPETVMLRAPTPASSLPSSGGAQPAGNVSELLDALRRGLQAPALDLPVLTPALMELLGTLLREAVAGTVDLLRARTAVKHEMRAEVTTIVPRHNNPLKFSPSAEAALQYLLAPPARGFMAAAPAMRDAYDDLRAHQLAVMAGMQALLDAALQRFDPVSLESRLGDPSWLHSLLPASRHARLWEMFSEHYARIRNEATSDFHASFGRAFLAAYDEHVERLRDQRAAETPRG